MRVKIVGKVQGVFFRASTKEKADSLGIKGMVRNERDGGVYIEAEGGDKILNEFLQWCKKGPPSAIVAEIKIVEGDPKYFKTFEIVRSWA